MPAAVTNYLAAVTAYDRKFGATGGPLRHYPGSPRLIRAGLRAGDRFIACELHPQDALALKREFAGDRAVEVQEEDGYHALKALLPPPERRGLVFIDSPFEAADEFEIVKRALRHGLRRFAIGCYAIWYPIKDEPAVEGFAATFASPKSLRLELRVPPSAPGKLAACGVLVINPPWKFEEAMGEALPWVVAQLGPGVSASFFAGPAAVPA
jgi:23S rRNA (adenine2030-N6)-methyltransferase